jgi:hypothetical protein
MGLRRRGVRVGRRCLFERLEGRVWWLCFQQGVGYLRFGTGELEAGSVSSGAIVRAWSEAGADITSLGSIKDAPPIGFQEKVRVPKK